MAEAIKAESLGKKYTIIRHEDWHEGLRDAIGAHARRVLGRTVDVIRGGRPARSKRTEEIWALRDVDFGLRHGEVVGVIGGNGAGKSTLLKVLSQITEPSAGRVTIEGRVASLLEVGTGFHPELTGRENVYLNGAVLGMSRSEIDRRFDEIVEFSGVERFLETPVKRFSSGMALRLAFSVAAHLEPEILLVDEVLAVGDADFRRRCLEKMKSVVREGRSVLFVSHNMAAISGLCPRTILLADGRIVADGSTKDIIARYLQSGAAGGAASFDLLEGGRVGITRVEVDRLALESRDLLLELDFQSPVPLSQPTGGVVLRGGLGEPAWASNGIFHQHIDQKTNLTHGRIRCEARGLPLVPGEYTVSVWLSDLFEELDSKLDVLRIQLGQGEDPLRPTSYNGYLDWPGIWRTIDTGSPNGPGGPEGQK